MTARFRQAGGRPLRSALPALVVLRPGGVGRDPRVDRAIELPRQAIAAGAAGAGGLNTEHVDLQAHLALLDLRLDGERVGFTLRLSKLSEQARIVTLRASIARWSSAVIGSAARTGRAPAPASGTRAARDVGDCSAQPGMRVERPYEIALALRALRADHPHGRTPFGRRPALHAT